MDQHPSVLEARRQARLLETQNEFEMAMKSHQKKNKRPGTTSNVAGTRDFTSSSSSSKYEEAMLVDAKDEDDDDDDEDNDEKDAWLPR